MRMRPLQIVNYRKSVRVLRKLHIPYLIFSIALPLCAIIAALGGTVCNLQSLTRSAAYAVVLTLDLISQAFGAPAGLPWCFLRGSEWWTWGLFFIPGTRHTSSQAAWISFSLTCVDQSRSS